MEASSLELKKVLTVLLKDYTAMIKNAKTSLLTSNKSAKTKHTDNNQSGGTKVPNATSGRGVTFSYLAFTAVFAYRNIAEFHSESYMYCHVANW